MDKEKKVGSYEELLRKSWAKAVAAKRREILDFHNRQISFLQHERAIHLAVTLFFGGSCLFLGWVVLISVSIYFPILFLIMLITTTFYVAHYYNLENCCQRWQKLSTELEKELIWKK